MIIKNRFGKKPMELKISLNFYGKIYLFIYSKIVYCGKYTSSNNFVLSYSKNGGEFHGVIIGKNKFKSVEIGGV